MFRLEQTASETRPGRGHNLAWTEWGDRDNPRVLICAHGLSRNGRDFDFLARELAGEYRVVCPDYPGRGRSSWLHDKSAYTNQQYCRDTLNLINNLDFEVLDWVGTSMGGLIGMAIAAEPDSPIRKMVVNDVGPFIPGAALREIGDYLGRHPRFASRTEALDYYRNVYASFGALEDEHYEHFVAHGVAWDEEADHFRLEYDPAIIDEFLKVVHQDIELWDVFDRIEIPLLILRGKKSGLLLPQTVEQMKHRHGNAISHEFEDCAHAPSLMVPEQIDVIRNWLATDHSNSASQTTSQHAELNH